MTDRKYTLHNGQNYRKFGETEIIVKYTDKISKCMKITLL
jgi:hypothetical protein